jgi:hypothetical protein
MLLTAIRDGVHVALAEPILRIGAARQARLWLKKDSETIPPPCLNVPHACDGTAAASEGAVTQRTLVRLVSCHGSTYASDRR